MLKEENLIILKIMSLATLSAQIRSFLKWFLISIAALIIIWIVWILIRDVSRLVFKPKGEDVAYGQVSPPLFVKTYYQLDPGKAELSTPAPKTSDKALVYTFSENKGFSEQQIDKLIKYFNLSKNSKKEGGNIISWQDSAKLAVLSFDKNKNYFTYRYLFEKDLSVLSGTIAPFQSLVFDKIKKILQSLELPQKEFNKESGEIKYYKLSNEKRVIVEPNVANTTEVTFFRKLGNINAVGIPILRILFGGNNKILEFVYSYSPIDPIGSPYPIITSDEAWKNFKDGNSYIANSNKYSEIAVEKMYLSYWESSLPQTYLQPVWVFVGTGNINTNKERFTSLLPAISPSYLFVEEPQP